MTTILFNVFSDIITTSRSVSSVDTRYANFLRLCSGLSFVFTFLFFIYLSCLFARSFICFGCFLISLFCGLILLLVSLFLIVSNSRSYFKCAYIDLLLFYVTVVFWWCYYFFYWCTTSVHCSLLQRESLVCIPEWVRRSYYLDRFSALFIKRSIIEITLVSRYARHTTATWAGQISLAWAPYRHNWRAS